MLSSSASASWSLNDWKGAGCCLASVSSYIIAGEIPMLTTLLAIEQELLLDLLWLWTAEDWR